MVISRTLAILALLAGTAGSPGALAAACTASAGTLDAAKSVYAARCAPIPRVDCDPVSGAWTCSSERIDGRAPGAGTVVIQPTAPTPGTATPGAAVNGIVPVSRGWKDSYSAGGRCYIASTFDHGAGDILVDTPVGRRTVRQVARAIGPGPGVGSNPVYNDVQCGNGPANSAGDEDFGNCPGRVDMGGAGCGIIGPLWDLVAAYGTAPSTPSAPPATPSTPSAPVTPSLPGGACDATGPSLAAAKLAYSAACSAPRVDCDPEAGAWRCASYGIGLNAPGQTPSSSSTPPTPSAFADPSSPVLGSGPSTPAPSTRSGVRGTSVVKLPLRLENLYKYNVTAITNMWTTDFPGGVPTQIVSFYNERKRVHIATREFPHGQFGKAIDIDDKVQPGDTLEPDSHNSTSVAVAPDGTVFVTANHHVDELNLAKTSRPFDLTSFVNVPAEELGGDITDRITYPSFFRLGGYLWLSAREQDIGRGTNWFRWQLWRYNHDTGDWDIRTRINGGQRLRLYLSNIDWNADESEINFLGVWREEEFREGLSQNTDLFHLTSRDGVRFEHTDGTPVELPLVWDSDRNRATSGDHEVPVKVWDTSAGDPQPYQPGSVIFDGGGMPHMLIKEMAGGSRDTWHHRWDSGRGAWVSRKTGMATHTDDLLTLPDGRVGMVGHVNDAIYFLDLSTPGARRVLLAKGYHTRDFEVHVGKMEMRRGYLSIWLMENGHALPGRLQGERPTDAWILTIALDELSDFDSPAVRGAD